MTETTFRHSFPRADRATHRDEALVAFASGKRVLHVGCTDWPFTDEKITAGTLLHRKLQAVAQWVGGVDVDSEGLDKLDSALGGDYFAVDVTTGDVEALPPCDVVIAADVVEHVPDERGFLLGLAAVARQSGASVVLSTPNALSPRGLLYTAFGTEVIHPDHRRLHSPRTLLAACASAGLAPVEWQAYNIESGTSTPRRATDLVVKALSRWRWAYSDGLILQAVPAEH